MFGPQYHGHRVRVTRDSGAESLVFCTFVWVSPVFSEWSVCALSLSSTHLVSDTKLTRSCFLTTHKRVKGVVEEEWTFPSSRFPVCDKSLWLLPVVSPEDILACLIKTDTSS